MTVRDRQAFVRGVTPRPDTSETVVTRVIDESPEKLSGDIKPSDLRDYNGPLYVRNNTRNVISHDDGRGNVFRLDPKGSSTDLLPFPLLVAQHHGIQKIWRQGKITVSTDPDLEESLRLEAVDTAGDRGGILDATMEEGNKNDMHVLQCLIGGEQVLLTKDEIDNGVPPLCEDHDIPSNAARCVQVGENKVWKFQ